jgi:PadR family transcriptional regulator PadR
MQTYIVRQSGQVLLFRLDCSGDLDALRDSCYTDSMSTVDNLSERLEFLQGTLEVLILRSLQMGPNHAYGIGQLIEHHSDSEFLVDNGSLYPALQRLLQRDWITAQWKTSPNSRRAKYYRLTPRGRKQLLTATSKWERFVEAMGRVLAPKGGTGRA